MTYTQKILMLLLILALAAVAVRWQPLSTPSQTACTMEAMLCPDGSSVGRTGPDCAFAPCPKMPEQPIPSNPPSPSLTISDSNNEVTMSVPQSMETSYVTASDRPPTLTTFSGETACTGTGQTIAGAEYCVETQAEGAAGSVYTTYTYSRYITEIDQTVSIEFVLRTVQCENFDEPESTACKDAQGAFDVEKLVDALFATMKITKK